MIISLKSANTIYLLIFILINITKNDDTLDDKFYFQLYPSESKEKPFLFHAYTPNSRFITINSTEGENCKILENRTVSEYSIKDLSSVVLFNKTFLVKTCFGPDSIVEITDEKNETFSYKNNNLGTEQKSIDKLKFCYSTAVYNPLNKNQIVIMTYWTDYIIEKGKENYVHKCIIFNPETKNFSSEKYLTVDSNIIERLVNKNYYARSCITFRTTDIYCSINLGFGLKSDTSYANSFIIETSKIYSSDPQIHLIFSNTDFGENIFQKPIAIGKEIHDIFGGFFDAFLTEYHHKKDDKIILVSSLFRKSLHASFISVIDSSKKYYGINVEDSYVDQNLFNHLLPNENDLIVIYTMKTRDGMGLVMTRMNLTNSVSYHKKFKEYSVSNYLREDICSKPKYIQSIFVNSFINYSERDKSMIKILGNEQYYKYQKDIVTLLSCEDENKNVFYESKKIIMPQCLNELDEINNKDYHYIKYKDNEDNVILDIFNDPNLLSLRNITIEFLPIDLKNTPIIIMVKTDKTNYTYINHMKTNVVENPTHIRIFRTLNFNTKIGLALPYRIKQTSYMGSAITCHLSSDICKFELIKVNDDECNIDYCVYCEKNSCKECKSSIEGILLDSINNRCVCNINKGFQLYPQIFYSIFEMCICKEDYSFYKNISLCRPNNELKNGSYYVDRQDDVSLIDIYDDCPQDCEYCEVKNRTNGIISFKCPNGNVKEMTESVKTEILDIDDETFIPSEIDICINKENSDENIWFKYVEYNFYFAKIEQCVYIIFNNSLFFYSNKADCLLTDKVSVLYISNCLNINSSTFANYEEYKTFIDNSIEYNPNEESIVIHKEIDNYHFHLVNKQKSQNFSELEISPECESNLKQFYKIDNDLLIFKVDIRAENRLLIQVEYSFYNPDPQKIYEKLDLYKCYPKDPNTKRILKLNNNGELKLDQTYILYPINITDQQRKNIKELYENNIFLFDSKEDFYNKVCYKYTTPKKSDIYIDDRRKFYYINERVCPLNCTVYDYNIETDKIKCQCTIKYSPQSPEEIPENIENPFNGRVIAPNLQALKCPKEAYGTSKNFGLFFPLLLLIAFIILYLHRIKFSLPSKFNFLRSIFDEDKKNLLNESEDLSDDEPDHKYNPDKKHSEEPPCPKEKNLKNDELQEEDINNNEGTVFFKKRNIKNTNVKKMQGNQNNINPNSNKGESIDVNPEKNEDEGNILNIKKEEKKGKNIDEDLIDDESNHSNLIDLSRTDNEYNSEDKIKNIKKIKRTKSKKNLIDDNNVNSDENQDEKDSKKRKKSKSKSKKKKKLKREGDNIENDNENNKGKKKENDKKDDKKDIEESSIYTEGAKIKKEQNNEHYDNDKENEKNKEKEIVDINAIMNNSNTSSFITNNNIIKNEDKKKVNNLFDNDDEENDEDMVYDLDLIDDDKKEKSENNNTDKQPSKKKKKKKKKKGKNPANPPRKEDLISVKSSEKNHTSFISEKKEIKNDIIMVQNQNNNSLDSSNRFLKKNNNDKSNKDIINIDYLLDNLSFEKSIKQDKRGLLQMLLSLIKNNNTIFFIFNYDNNDLFAKGSVLILSLSIYVFINIILMLDSSLLHLYVGRDKDLGEKFEGTSFAINISIPSLMYIVISLVKKRVSLNEFIYDKLDEYREICKEICKNDNEKKKQILKMHSIQTDVSKFKNKTESNTTFIFVVGIIFLIINWYVATCFCGIYENSFSCLITNALMSMIFTFILTLILYIISSIFRYFAKKKKMIALYSLSTLLNPCYILYVNEYRNNRKEEQESKEKEDKKINKLD